MKQSRFSAWINARFPVLEYWNDHAAKYFVPKNLNFWYLFGIFSTLVLVNQIFTGIWLAMYYQPSAAHAFASVEHIMREVHFGWLIRYMHSTGASALFVVIYLHMYRAVMYGSYKAPRELVWLIGMALFSLLMVESASGYVLPWGQMSYWATKVLVQVFTVIPWIGDQVALWIAGDYNISGVTLHRFYAFHVILFPLIILFFVVGHIIALHRVGSNNPDGIDIKKQTLKNEAGKPIDSIPFHPYYTVKDLMGVAVFLIIFFVVVFFMPTGGGYILEHANFKMANPMVTPQHIAPPWYLAPLYAVLRAVPNKLMGVACTALFVALLYVMPWLDRSKVRSIRYRGIWTKIAICVLVISFIALAILGTMPLTDTNIWFSRLFGVLYLLYFVLMPFYTKYEKCKPVPERVRF